MQLKIGQRILGGFILIIALAVGLGAYQTSNIAEMRSLAETIVETDFRTLILLRRISDTQRDMQILKERAVVLHFYEREALGTRESREVQEQWSLARQRLFGLIDELLAYVASERERASDAARKRLYAQVEEQAREKRQVLTEISTIVIAQFDLVNRGEVASLRSTIPVLDELRAKFIGTNTRAESLAAELPVVAENSINARYESAVTASIYAILAVVAIGLAAAWLLHRSITRPLADFMGFVERVGRGDLTQKTASTGSDEFGRLGQYLNTMVDGLAEVARQSREATGQLTASTAELQASSKQQAASTSEQSAAIQQITSTLDEIAQSGTQISERAKAVAAAAAATASISKAGLDAVTETSQAMSSIGEQAEAVAGNIVALTEKTRTIGEIVAGVNDIAERSDLLALNAAIEAAAAGEGGRSFSVIADEMKNLADQAKDATRRVRDLLGDIQQGISASVMQTEEAVKRAEAGQRRTSETERTIRGLVESVEESIATFQQIVAATNQQQIGIEQVAQSIQSIREASEQMAAGIRDLEQSAGNLGALGSQLTRSVERYAV